MTRYVLYKKEVEAHFKTSELQRLYRRDRIAAIKEALIETMIDDGEQIAIFDNLEEGLKKVNELRCSYQYVDRFVAYVILYSLVEEKWDEEDEDWYYAWGEYPAEFEEEEEEE